MEEELDLKPDIFKLETELILYDHAEDREFFTESYSEIDGQGLSANLPENSDISTVTGGKISVKSLPATNHDAPILAQQIKVEPTEDESVSAGFCEESRIQNAIVTQQTSIVPLERIDLSLANRSSSVSLSPNNGAPDLTAHIKVENENNEDPPSGQFYPGRSKGSDFLIESSIPPENNLVLLKDGFNIKSEDVSIDDQSHTGTTPPFNFAEIDTMPEIAGTSTLTEPSAAYLDTKPFEFIVYAGTVESDLRTDANNYEKDPESDPLVPSMQRFELSKFDKGPLTCEKCQRQFNRRVDLLNHMRAHSDEKPFSCEQCSKRFNRQVNLTQHLRSHSNGNFCELCQKQFRSLGQFMLHLRFHSVSGLTDSNISKESQSPEALSPAFENSVMDSSGAPVNRENSITKENVDQEMVDVIDLEEIEVKAEVVNTSSASKEPSKLSVKTKPIELIVCPDTERSEIEATGASTTAMPPCSVPFKSELNEFLHFDTSNVDVEVSNKDSPKILSSESCVRETGLEQSEERPFTCSQCFERFSFQELLDKHFLTHSDGKPFYCKQCLAQFTSYELFCSHLCNLTDPAFKPVETTVKILNCDQCSAKYTQKWQFDQHLKSHSKFFSCKQCPAQLTTEASLLLHMSSYHVNKSFSCQQCDKKFNLKENLFQHLRSHSDDLPFSCQQCDKKFNLKENLFQHLRSHSDDLPFSCQLCDRKFNEKGHYLQHLHLHSNENIEGNFLHTNSGDILYSCGICSAKFKEKRYLLKHLSTHSEEKPFSCDMCSAKFKERRYLTKHLYGHGGEKPFACEKCDAKFEFRFKLVNHLRCHSEERPFQCEMCPAKFRSKHSLTRHWDTHSEGRTFSCQKCSAKFKFKQTLTKHLRSHGEERHLPCEKDPSSSSTAVD